MNERRGRGSHARGLLLVVASALALEGSQANARALASESPAATHAVTSTDAGESWTRVGRGLPVVRAVTFGPERPAVVYAGTRGGVFKTSDGGRSWRGAGLAGRHVWEIVVNLRAPRVFYAATEDGVVKTTDGGRTWRGVNVGLPRGENADSLVLNPKEPDTLYASTGEGVFKTTNGARRWRAASTGLAHGDPTYELAIDPQRPTTLYVQTTSGICKTTDGGGRWRRVGWSEDLPWTLAVDPQRSGTVYVSGERNGSGMSTDGGRTWRPLADYSVFYAQAFAFDPRTPAVVVATEEGVYRSADGVRGWEALGLGLPAGYVDKSQLLFDPTRRLLFAVTDEDLYVYRPPR